MTQSNDRTGHEAGGLTRAALIKRGLAGAGALSGAAVLAACGDDSDGATTSASAPERTAAASGKQRTIIWALAAIAPWNLPVDVGFIEATNVLGWKYQKVGVPISEYSPETVVSVIRRATQARPDVLVTPGWVPGAYTAMEEAQKQGILVMINDANNSPDVADRLGLAHVGTDEKVRGITVGQAVVAAAKKKGHTSGTIIFGNPYPGNANIEAWGAGVKEAAGSQYKVVVYKEPIDAADAIAGYKAQMTKYGDDLVAITPNQQEAPVVKALREAGKKPGDITVGSFNDSVATADQLKQGWVTVLLASQYYTYGWVSTMLAYQALERGIAPRRYLTGGSIVDSSNVDDFLAQVKEREELAKKYKVKLA